MPSGDTLISALKRRYKTPQAVLRKLGLDETLLEREEPDMPYRPNGRDQEGEEGEPLDANSLAQSVAMALINMGPDQQAAFLEQIGELINNGGDVEMWAESVLGNANGAADRLGRRRARDTRSRRITADDSAADRGFAKRFGHLTQHIDIMPGGDFADKEAIAQRQRAALKGSKAASSFASRLPNAAKIQVS
jgi:hypothetical protein